MNPPTVPVEAVFDSDHTGSLGVIFPSESASEPVRAGVSAQAKLIAPASAAIAATAIVFFIRLVTPLKMMWKGHAVLGALFNPAPVHRQCRLLVKALQRAESRSIVNFRQTLAFTRPAATCAQPAQG
jgi:hypothetical protein